jgi:hypothetical protein
MNADFDFPTRWAAKSNGVAVGIVHHFAGLSVAAWAIIIHCRSLSPWGRDVKYMAFCNRHNWRVDRQLAS